MSDLHAHFYTWAEVCLLTTLAESTIREMQPKGTFPWHEPLSDGRRVGFPKDEVDDWLKNPKAWKRRNRRHLKEAARRRNEGARRRDENVADDAPDTSIWQL